MTERYVSTPEAARELGIAVSTLQDWAKKGRITPAWRTPGGHYQWSVSDLRRQLNMPAATTEEPVTERSDKPEPETVAAAIVTSDKGVLVGKRNDGKPPWTFIAGKIHPGESPADAAVREVKEETGLRITAGDVIGRRVHPATGRTMVYMAARPTHGTDVFVGDEEELAEVRWISLAEADELLPGMFEPVREHLAHMIGNHRNGH